MSQAVRGISIAHVSRNARIQIKEGYMYVERSWNIQYEEIPVYRHRFSPTYKPSYFPFISSTQVLTCVGVSFRGKDERMCTNKSIMHILLLTKAKGYPTMLLSTPIYCKRMVSANITNFEHDTAQIDQLDT